MGKRYANYRLVKIHRNYTAEEAADLLEVHKNTVRLWTKNGLPAIDDRRPFLILGVELAKFLQARKAKHKRLCKVGEFYCLRCREPRCPAEGMADCFRVSDKLGHLQAFCPNCLCIMNRRVSLAKLGQFSGILSIKFPMAQEQVSDTNQPNLNSDFNEGA